MKFSIIIPAYNSEKYIAETLECILGQSEKDIEIIVINDGSKDSTQSIAESFAENHSQIVLVNQENAGVSAARNNGIELAKGEYTVFIDSDDLISGDALEKLYAALKSTDADLAIFRVQSFGVGGEKFNPVVDDIVKDVNISCYDKRLIRNFLVSNKVYKTKLLKESGVRFPPMKYTEDGAFFMQFIHTVKPKITGVADALFMYRRHTASVTHRVNSTLVAEFSKSMDYIYGVAKNSFADCPEEKEAYIQELLFKDYMELINEFYRMLWKAEDEETLTLIGERCAALQTEMKDATKAKCSRETRDLGQLLFSKNAIAENPFISVVAENPTQEFLNSLYDQTMPLFEIVEASEKTKGKITLHFKGNEVLDPRLFKGVSLLKRSGKLSFLPDRIILLGAKLVLKLKK